MDDFASAVFVAGLRAELSVLGIDTPAPPVSGARVTLGAKRALLGDVAAGYGLDPLLRAGAALVDHVPGPALAALLAATSPTDLMARWCRLERFLHSRHHVVVHEAIGSCLVAAHVGPVGQPPTPAEDAVVLGLLTGLFGAVGAQGLVVRAGTGSGYTVVRDGRFRGAPAAPGTGEWRFCWRSWRARPGAVADDVDVDVATDATGSADAVDSAGVAGRCRALVVEDLGRRWSVAEVAALLGMSCRTLQRRLAGVGGLTAVVAAARVGVAADLLIEDRHPLAVVGFACGYADQPHFTREFRHRTGMTPAAYRSAFAHRGSGPEGGHGDGGPPRAEVGVAAPAAEVAR